MLPGAFGRIKELTGAGWLSRWLKAWGMRQPRHVKRTVVIFTDLLLLSGIMALIVWVCMEADSAFNSPSTSSLLALAALPFISVAALYFTGFYQFVTRHIGRKGLWHIGYSMLITIMAWALLIFLTEWRVGLIVLPRTVVAAYFFAGWMAILMLRDFARWWLRDMPL